jgi:hypothetical protein
MVAAEEFDMSLRNMALSTVVGLGLVATGIVVAQAPPVRNIGNRNPNLEAAQHLVDQAFNKITAAQQANEFDMDGHAAKAKDFLDQANRELKAAAIAADKKHR